MQGLHATTEAEDLPIAEIFKQWSADPETIDADELLFLVKGIFQTDGNYLASKSGLGVCQEQRVVPLSDTIFVPLVELKIFQADGNVRRELRVVGLRNGRILEPIITLQSSDLKGGIDWVQNSWGFKIRIHKEPGVSSYILDTLNLICGFIPTQHVYEYIGWSAEKQHKGNFITGAGPIGRAHDITVSDALKGFRLKTSGISSQEAFEFVHDVILRVCSAEISYPTFSYMLLSLLTSRLKNWRFKPEFVYYLYGPTGSRKTSYCKLMFNIYDKFRDSVTVNFSSTQAAMETMFTQMRDCVLLIDDIAPSTDPQEKQAIRKKLENIIRSYGDSVGRQKMVSIKARSETPPPCGLTAVTAEENVISSSSSRASTLFLNVDRDSVDLEILSEAQRRRKDYTTAIAHYISFISSNYKSFIDDFKRRFEVHHQMFQTLHPESHGRLTLMMAWLHTAFEAYLHYAAEAEFISKKRLKKMLRRNQEILEQQIKVQDLLFKQQNEVELFVQAIKEMLASGHLKILPVKITGNKKIVDTNGDTGVIDGYRDPDNQLYLLSARAYQMVVSWYARMGIAFPVSDHTLYSRLHQVELLIADANKDGTKTTRITVNGQRVSVIRLDLKKLASWGE